MDILLKTRCTKGHLIISNEEVSVGYSMLGSVTKNSLPFSKITGVEVKTTMAAIPILCVGYATVKIYSTGEQVLIAEMVKLKDALEAEKVIKGFLQK